MEILDLEKDFLPIGTTAVHVAVNSGRVEGLQSLLDGDCSLIDHPDQYGHTPLTVALQNNRLEAARMLIQYGAKLDSQYGRDTQRTIAQVLITTPAFYSLLQFVVKSNVALPYDMSTLLPAIAYEGDADMLEAVLHTGNVKVDYRDYLNCTALHYASRKGFLDIVEILLTYNVTTTLKNSSGSMALHLACSAGHLNITKAILEADTSSEKTKHLLNTKNIAGHTPVICALSNMHLEVVQYLLTTHMESIDTSQIVTDGHTLSGFCFYLRFFKRPSLIKFPYQSTLPCLSSEEAMWLLHESVYMNDTTALKIAIGHGASVECLDYMKQTPLVLAAKLGLVEMCKSLIESGADPSLTDMSGKTPLVHAIEHGKPKVVAYFLSQIRLSETIPYSLTSPLSSVMLPMFVSHFEESNHKPSSWISWLALAAPTAPNHLFSKLVNAIAPHDWILQLLAKCSGTDDTSSPCPKVCRVAKHMTLPTYVQIEIEGELSKPRPKLVRSLSRPRKWYFTRPPPSTSTQWTFRHIPRPKKLPSCLRKKGTPFSLHKTRKFPSVIHEAALRNIDAFKFILSSCENAELQEKVLLSRDDTGRTALELVLPQFCTVSEAFTSLELREFTGLDRYLREEFTLPESLLFEDALVHYLCVGQHVLSSQHMSEVQSPLQTWPLWYLQQQVNALYAHYETGSISLAELEDRKELLHLLLDHNFLPSNWVEKYPSPLFAAIQHNHTWAVEPLLLHGADPATHYNGRFAIEEAAKRGQKHTVYQLLQGGYAPFLALTDNPQLFASLCSALASLVSANYIKDAVETLNLSHYLWCSRYASHFLYVAQALYDGSYEYESIVRDFVTFLCTEMLDWESKSSQETSAVLQNLSQLRHRCFLHRVNVCHSTKNLSLLIKLCRYVQHPFQKVSFGEFFHFLCGSGNYAVVNFLLQSCDRDIAERLVNKPDNQCLTPLFHAACSGRLNVVKLLLQHSAIITSSPGVSPIVGALLYYALAPYNVGGDILGKSCVFISEQRRRSLQDYRNFLAKCSFSYRCYRLAKEKQLVELLLPAKSESIYAYLSKFPTSGYGPLHTLLILISAARETAILEPLLERIVHETLPPSLHDTSDTEKTTNKSVLSAALELAPVNAGSKSSQLFERFLLLFVPDSEFSLTDVSAAARKGYWDVIDAAVSAKRIISATNTSAVVQNSKREFARLQSCLFAIKAGKRDLVSLLLQLGPSPQLPICQWWPHLVSAAVRTDHKDIVCDLISAGCNVLLCLQAAARWGNVDILDHLFRSLPLPVGEVSMHFVAVLTVAAQNNQHPIIQVLFNLYQNHHEIIIDAKLSRDVSFWLWVLAHSTRNGHQGLALQAVSYISEQEMNSVVSQHPLYHDILYYSSSWGLSELLVCLPLSEGALLARQAHESPLEAAIANGRLSCIPKRLRFPPNDNLVSWLEERLDSWLEDSLDSKPKESPCNMKRKSLLLSGLYHQLYSLKSTNTSQSYIASTKFRSVLCMPNAFTAFQNLTGEFCAPILVYALKRQQLDIVNAAVDRGDHTLLEQVLRTLLSSGYFSEYCTHSNVSAVLSKAVECGHTACLELLLRSGEIFVKQLSLVDRGGHNTLHSAVMGVGHNVDTLTVVLDWLASSAPDMCLVRDLKGVSPISLAFQLGEYERAAKLLERAQFSVFWQQQEGVKPDWKSEATKARGWDRVISTKYGRKATGDKVKLYPVQANIRSGQAKSASKLFKYAVHHCNSELVNALLVASCGFLLEDRRNLTVGLLDPSVLMFLSKCPSYVSISQFDATVTTCCALKKRDCSKEVKVLMNLINQHLVPISLDRSKVFVAACAASRLILVNYFLQNEASMPIDVLQEGAVEALNRGAREVAAAILISDTSNHGLSVDLISWAPTGIQVIFSPTRDYHTVVEDFFGSLARRERGRHLSFSNEWLVHQWGPRQHQLMGNVPKTPPNPWMVGVQWQDQPHTVALTVDWESFAECLQNSPLYVQMQLQCIPMLVEAVVFSSSVLGQLCLTEDKDNPIYNMTDLFDSPVPLKSVVLSAVVWPHPPSACLTSPEEGLLTISFKPNYGVFVFPAVETTDRACDESYSTDSGMHSFCLTDSTSIDTKCDESNTSLFTEGFSDLCKFYQKKLKHVHRTSTTIALDGISRVTDTVTSFAIFSSLQSIFDDCSEAIHLSTLPTTAYASIPRRWWHFPAPPPKKLFSHIGVNIDAAEPRETSSAVVSLVDSGLDFSIELAIDNTVTPPIADIPSFELLLQQTVYCTLNREVEILRERVKNLISTRIIPRMQLGLRCTLDRDCVEVLVEDIHGTTADLSQTTISHLKALKALPSIRTFLYSFCDILRAYSHKPKLLTGIRSSFQGGFRLVISEVSATDVTIHLSLPQLTILISDLGHPQRQSAALLSLTASLLKLTQQNGKGLLKDVPCPFLTHVDLSRSKGFLYPRVGSVAKLFIQVVSYEEEKLTLPLKYNCCLQVVIHSPSAQTLKASSSEEPRCSSHGSSTNLLITTSENGQFEVSWTPVEEGLHTVSLTMNGVVIQRSFKRVFVEGAVTCSGKRQVSAESPMVFIAAHVGYKCPYTSCKSKVVLVRDTVLEPSPFLKDVPGFTTRTVPFGAPLSSSSQHSTRPSDKLKEAVSAMAAHLPANTCGLESPLPLLHHVSVTAAYDGSRSWSHVSSASVTVHVKSRENPKTGDKRRKESRKPSIEQKKSSKSHVVPPVYNDGGSLREGNRVPVRRRKRPKRSRVNRRQLKSSSFQSNKSHVNAPIFKNASSMPLGHGMYRVSVQCHHAGSYRVFASCPVCQSVMRIYWLDEQSFYPQPYYVVPGPFSFKTSTIFDGKNGNHPGENAYTYGSHGFLLNCCDEYGNPHTVASAVKKVVVEGAGRLDIGPVLSLDAILSSPPRPDSVCQVTHVGGGTYSLKCGLYGAGEHRLLVTTTRGKTECMASIFVAGQYAIVWPPHCFLDPSNIYEAKSFETYTCYIHLFDQYFNSYRGCRSNVKVLLDDLPHPATLTPTLAPKFESCFKLEFTPRSTAEKYEMKITIDSMLIGDTPKVFSISKGRAFQERVQSFRKRMHNEQLLRGLDFGFVAIDRSSILQSALWNQRMLKHNFKVRFNDENGIDMGGISREFFHLLIQELVNPEYALFKTTNGLYRPSPYSSVNPSHLQYFELCGKVLARMIYDDYQTEVRFTPAVYKYLLGQESTLDDLKIEDPTLYKGLMSIACCDNEESLNQLAMDFTTTHSHFGSLETVELERGGKEKKVTLHNKDEFLRKFCQFHVNGCIERQLVNMRTGFNTIIPHDIVCCYLYWHDLEMILCGQSSIDISFMKSCTGYNGYTAESQVVVWLWQALESFSEKEWCQYIQFITGSPRLPLAESGQWKMEIKRGPPDESLLPTASTCFNSLSLPCYTELAILKKKLMQAIAYDHLTFLNH